LVFLWTDEVVQREAQKRHRKEGETYKIKEGEKNTREQTREIRSRKANTGHQRSRSSVANVIQRPFGNPFTKMNLMPMKLKRFPVGSLWQCIGHQCLKRILRTRFQSTRLRRTL